LAGLCPAVLDGFIVASSGQLARGSLAGVCSALRLFLRYLYREEIIERDLSSLVEAPRDYRLSTIPRSISSQDVQRMLKSVDRRSPLGKRDFAMLLLLTTYGLRAREVASLTLDEIDWRDEKLAIPERKAGHAAVFPLSPLVGEALLDYLKHGRPKTTERSVFLYDRAPLGPITHRTVSLRATHYLRKSGVEVHRPGSHTLRHSCAQRLVDADFSLKIVGDYLGPRSPSSTEIYAKVGIEALREVALGDGEEIL
jgi:site-specific recombinase XerD